MDGDGWVEYARLRRARASCRRCPHGEAEVAGVRVSVSGDEVADDWAERWKRFHRPVLVGGRLRVRPPWEQPVPSPG